MSWILIECFFYTFWIRDTDLARFSINQEDMHKILERMRQLQKPKGNEPYMLPYDTYEIPELEKSNAVSNMKMTRSKTCVNLIDL